MLVCDRYVAYAKLERALRGPVVGRKLSYGSHSECGADLQGILLAVFGTLSLAGLDLQRWLRAYLRECAAIGPQAALADPRSCRPGGRGRGAGAQLRYFVHARDGLPLALLAQVERCLPADWHSRYNLRPVLLETFCETPRFRGTCYRAANWLHLGQPLGRGKLDTHNEFALPIKDIFVKPLCADWKAVLNR